MKVQIKLKFTNLKIKKKNLKLGLRLYKSLYFAKNIFIFKVFSILAHLPRKRNGKIRVEEFIHLPIISEDAFKAIDR